MTGRLWGGRRAEAFQNAVDGQVDLTEYELAEFVRLAHALRDMPPVTLGNEARSSLRARLVAEAETVLGGSTVPPPSVHRRRRRHRGLRIAAGSTAAVAAVSAGLVSMSADALPGDMLYPLKRGVEQVELTVGGGGAAATGHTRLDHASERLEEAEQLAEGGDVDQVGGVLDDFTSDAEIGAEQLLRAYASDGDRGAINEIRTFANASSDRLQAIAPMLGESSSTAYENAVAAVTDIDRQAVAACPECAGGPTVQVPFDPSPVNALPQDDRDGADGDHQSNDDLVAQPNELPHETDVPPIDHHADDGGIDQHDGDNGGQDDGTDGDAGPTLQGENITGSDSSEYDRPKTDDPNDTRPDVPQLDENSGSVVEALPLGPVNDALDPVQDLLDQLGPIGDLLDPVLGDKEEAEPQDPISELLDTLLGGRKPDDKAGDSKTKNARTSNADDRIQPKTMHSSRHEGAEQDSDDATSPADDTIDEVGGANDAPPVDQDPLDNLTDGATDGATLD